MLQFHFLYIFLIVVLKQQPGLVFDRQYDTRTLVSKEISEMVTKLSFLIFLSKRLAHLPKLNFTELLQLVLVECFCVL